jgi:hypothetical protein
MRLGAWLCAGALFSTLGGGCSGGYSLPPTPSADWCHVTQGSYGYSCSYGYYDPAQCVSQCEAEELSNEHCTALFDAALSCYRNTPGATTAACYYNPDPTYVPPCRAEYEALVICAAPYIQGFPGLPPSGGELPVQE